MSFSTTTSSSYVLSKYSKSYPSSAESSAEWQHFINPIIRLVLDVRKRSDGGELESVRLRILWSMNADDMAGANDVVFEDLELLSFAALLPRPSQRSNNPQGLPLKAVYRDSVVGIRYLSQREGDPSSNFRRFQVTFSSTTAAAQFIDSISSVCPCKANPPPANQSLTRQATLMGTPARPSPYSRPSVTPTRLPYAADKSIRAVDNTMLLHSAPSFALETQSSPQSHFVAPTPPSGLRKLPEALSPLVSSPSSLTPPSSYGNAYHNQQTSGASSQTPTAQADAPPPQSVLASRSMAPSQSPTVGLASVSASDSEMMPPPSLAASLSGSASQIQETDDRRDPLLAVIRQTSGLYDMPSDQLERVVGEIIREENFISLVEKIGCLWRIKSYLGVS
ncbi:hypothetical protein BD626DRAFT_624845 [Schizophyllum amplum]|uniref:Uncharacterized protein n=1 Tax=Schizophyllum amplum TaxID=97359 RepID=A0A550CXH2_9AGAR|nr:hypothetical protein BD626DRAFT_624845 [Auriculariopsis ampla]